MRDNPEGCELDPAEGIHRRCKKNSPSVLSGLDKRTREGCDRGSEVGTVHIGRDGKGPVPSKNRNLAEEKGATILRKISSLRYQTPRAPFSIVSAST